MRNLQPTPTTQGGARYAPAARPARPLSATAKVQRRAQQEDHASARLTDLGAKEQSYIGTLLVKLFKKFSRPKVRLAHPKAIRMVEALGLSQRQLRILKEKFDDIDVDSSGNIDHEEFFETMGEVRSKLTDELFRIMDLDGNARIDFDEYVAVSLMYCMYTKDDILKFCFDLFDIDGGGTIDEKEFVEMCKSVNAGDPLFTGNFRTALENFDLNADGLIDFDEFKAMNDRYPLVIYPAFRMQDKLQRHTLGSDEWVKVMENVAYHMKVAEYTEREGEPPPESFAGRIREKYLSACFGHPPVDLDYLKSQSKTNTPQDTDGDSSSDDEPEPEGSEPEGPPAAVM